MHGTTVVPLHTLTQLGLEGHTYYFNCLSVCNVFCLLGFKVRAPIFQLYSDDEHEMDDKMTTKWWWNEKKDGTQG